MLGKIFGILCIFSVVFGIWNGYSAELGGAVLDGAANAVQVTLSLCGMMCLWCGMMEVLTEAGAIRKLSRLLRPLLRHIFPQASETGEGLEEISANISANLLGIGNAATPFALRAMEKLQKHNPSPHRASAEQITLAVLNTAGFSLIPANLLALRRAAGSDRPYAVMIPVWIVSLTCATLAVLLTCIIGKSENKNKTKTKNK